MKRQVFILYGQKKIRVKEKETFQAALKSLSPDEQQVIKKINNYLEKQHLSQLLSPVKELGTEFLKQEGLHSLMGPINNIGPEHAVRVNENGLNTLRARLKVGTETAEGTEKKMGYQAKENIPPPPNRPPPPPPAQKEKQPLSAEAEKPIEEPPPPYKPSIPPKPVSPELKNSGNLLKHRPPSPTPEDYDKGRELYQKVPRGSSVHQEIRACFLPPKMVRETPIFLKSLNQSLKTNKLITSVLSSTLS